jgi:hypothetical protein
MSAFSPGEIDLLATQDGTTLGKIRAAIPAHCYEISPARAWGALARTVGCTLIFAGLQEAMLWNTASVLAGFFCNSMECNAA